MIDFLEYYKVRGHVFGECMTKPDTDLMYINIPKNASSWTKPNLKDWEWSLYNYHLDNLYHKHAVIALRDPLDRWISGISEYFNQFHPNLNLDDLNTSFLNLIFDRVAFDDHTEKQVLFIQRLDTSNSTFLKCDENYSKAFSNFLMDHGMENKYHRYAWQNVSSDPARLKIKNFFQQIIKDNLIYENKIKWYFAQDYELLNSVQFYGSR